VFDRSLEITKCQMRHEGTRIAGSLISCATILRIVAEIGAFQAESSVFDV
jgi:hypothetical protein